MFDRKNFSIVSVTIFSLVIILVSDLMALEYTSYIYTPYELIFFSYEDGTTLEIYETDGTTVYDWFGNPVVINGGNALNKGQHCRLSYPDLLTSQNHAYLVTGSKKFSVLTGDAATSDESSGVCGYYAMNPNGMGVANEFYTYVPNVYNQSFYEAPDVEPEQLKFIVFAYEDNTTVTVQRENPDDPNYYIDLTAPFVLDAGGHYAFVNLSEEYVRVSADKPVSALTAYDIGYQVPAADGGWAGTEFHTYVSDVHLHGVPFTIDQFMAIAAYEDSQVVIKNTQTQAIVYEGTLQKGQSHVN